MKILFLSDTHGAKFHTKINIPECDVIVHSGDIGGRTNLMELSEFLTWFDKLSVKKKIWIPGNHDLILDKDWAERQEKENVIVGMIAKQMYDDGQKLLNKFDFIYLLNSGFEYEGIKFWGSPYSPSFHRKYWAFNADRGDEIKQYWDMIPNDTDVLITHGPPKNILDACIDNGFNAGCEELLKKLDENNYLIHNFGHIHEGYGVYRHNNTLCINSSVLNEDYQLVNQPVLINIDENKKVTIINY